MMKKACFLAMILYAVFGAIAAEAQETGTWRVEVLERGAPIQGSNGMKFDGDDNLLIASATGTNITVMRPNGHILDQIGPERGVVTPDDVAIGSDGAIYWTSIFTGEIGRLTEEGGVTSTAVIARLPLSVNALGFNSDERLFVGLSAFGDGLYEIDPDGIDPPRLIVAEAGQPNSFDFGPDDGLLYAPLFARGEVARFDVNASTMETVAGGFVLPVSAKFAPDGELYVNDGALGHIVRVDRVTGEKEIYASTGPGTDTLAFDSSGRMYVSNTFDGSIKRILPNGSFIQVSPGGMIAPGGVAVVGGHNPHRDRVLVADLFSLRTLDGRNGHTLDLDLQNGLGLTSFSTVAAGDGGRLLLSSFFFNTVQVWDPVTEQVLVDVRDFAVPTNAIFYDGELVVAELATGNVVRADSDDPSQRQTLASGLAVPTGLAATEDELWVAEWATGNVLQVVAGGEVLAEPVLVAAGLALPEGMAVAPDGGLLVVESGAGRLSRIDPATGEVSTIAGDLGVGAAPLPALPPTWLFAGVAVGPSGAIYVGGDRDRVVYRITQH